jgi:hypothetical protein
MQLHRTRATVDVPSAPALGFLARAEICFGSTVNRRLRGSQVTLDNYLSPHMIRAPHCRPTGRMTPKRPAVAWDDARASFPSVDGCSLKYV